MVSVIVVVVDVDVRYLLFVECGSAAPLAVVKNVGYIVDSINATHAQLTWESVDMDVGIIRGFFRGYQVPPVSYI